MTSLTDASTSTLATYAYDANGNMTCRMEGNALYKQTYNTENRISSVQKLRSGACADASPVLETKWDFAGACPETKCGEGMATESARRP